MKKEKNKDSRDEGKTCRNKILEEFGRDGMEGTGASPRLSKEKSLLTPEPPQVRLNYRACVLIILNSKKKENNFCQQNS